MRFTTVLLFASMLYINIKEALLTSQNGTRMPKICIAVVFKYFQTSISLIFLCI